MVAQLTELQRLGNAYLRRDGIAAEDEQFYAEQNARLVASAEEYYRSMFGDPASSWNLRDRHMAETLDRSPTTSAATASGRGSSSGSTTPTSATRG